MSQNHRASHSQQADRGSHFVPGAEDAPDMDTAPKTMDHFNRGYRDRKANRLDQLPEHLTRPSEGNTILGLDINVCVDDLLRSKPVELFQRFDDYRRKYADAFSSGKAMTSLMAVAARRRSFHLANAMWEWMDTSPDMKKNTFHYNTMISVAEKMRDHQRALHLLQEMQDRGISKNEITYSSAISACEKTGEWQIALKLLDEMEQEGLAETAIVYNAAISACQRGLQPQVAMDVFRRMEKQGIAPTGVTFSALITAAEKGGQWKLALDLLNDMRSRGLECSVVAYSSAISALAKGQQWEKALELFRELQEHGEQPSIVTYNATMTALEKGMQWERALGLFEEMKMKNMPITVVSYGSAISACDKGLQYRQCLEYLDEMTDMGIEKNVIIFGAALSCMEKCHRADISFLLMERMKVEGIEPNVHVFNSAISACARCGLWEKGYELFLSMKERGVKRDVVTYNAVLDAVASQIDLGRKIFREGVELGFYAKVSRLAKNWFELDLHFLSLGGGEIGLGWWIEEAIVPYLEDSTLLSDIKSVTIVTGYGKTRIRGRREGDDGMRKRVLGMLKFMNLEVGAGTNAGRIAIDKEQLLEEARRQGGRIHFDIEGYTEWKRHNTTEFKIPDEPQMIRARFKPEVPGSGRPPFVRIETEQTSLQYRLESDGLTPADRENLRQDQIRKESGGNDIFEDRVPDRGGRGGRGGPRGGGRGGRGFGRGSGRNFAPDDNRFSSRGPSGSAHDRAFHPPDGARGGPYEPRGERDFDGGRGSYNDYRGERGHSAQRARGDYYDSRGDRDFGTEDDRGSYYDSRGDRDFAADGSRGDRHDPRGDRDFASGRGRGGAYDSRGDREYSSGRGRGGRGFGGDTRPNGRGPGRGGLGYRGGPPGRGYTPREGGRSQGSYHERPGYHVNQDGDRISGQHPPSYGDPERDDGHYGPSGSQGEYHYEDRHYDSERYDRLPPTHGAKRPYADSERQQLNRGYDIDQNAGPRTRPRY